MGDLKGPIPYGITWRLMLLKVLYKPLRLIRIFIPKLGKNHKEGEITKLKQWEISRVQYLIGLHGG